MAGGLLYFRQAGVLVVAVAIVVMLWIASLGYTAAGFIYSLRVLNPALVLAAVLGGAALARGIPGLPARNAVVFGLGLFATDAALRALVLPANVYRVPPAEWLNVGRAVQNYHERPIYRELARVAGKERMLVLGPNALLALNGARTVPLWSPDVRFVFGASLPPPEVARRLRAVDIGFVLINTGSVNQRFLARSAYLRDPAGTLQPLWSDSDMALFRVHSPPGP
jgi:hypothetical protein